MTYITRANFQAHPFHLVSPSPWPLYTSSTLFATTLSGVLTFHSFTGALRVLYTSLISVVYSMCLWFRDVINEATDLGNHTLAVQRRINMGVGLFIISEALFFLVIFWFFFHSALWPTVELGAKWPPLGIDSINPFELPLAVIFTTFLHSICLFAHFLLKVLLFFFFFGLIVMYSKSKYSINSEIDIPIYLFVARLFRFSLKALLFYYSFIFSVGLWCIFPISAVWIVCLGFIFYVVLECLINILSIIFGYIVAIIFYITCKTIVNLIYASLDLIITICVIIYTLFEVRHQGFIYNVYHTNTLYEKNWYGNLWAFGLIIYIVLIIIKLYFCMQNPYVYMNSQTQEFLARVLNPSGGEGNTPPPRPDFTIMNPIDSNSQEETPTSGMHIGNNLNNSLDTVNALVAPDISIISSEPAFVSPNLIQDGSSNITTTRIHTRLNSLFNIPNSSSQRVPTVLSNTGPIINAPYSANITQHHTYAGHSGNILAQNSIQSTSVLNTLSTTLVDPYHENAIPTRRVEGEFVHRYHPVHGSCIGLKTYYNINIPSATWKLEALLRGPLRNCTISILSFHHEHGLNGKNVAAIVLGSEVKYLTESGMVTHDVWREGDNFKNCFRLENNSMYFPNAKLRQFR